MRANRPHKILIMFLALILSVMLMQVSVVAAVRIDQNQSATLTIHYKEADKAAANVRFKLYRVADVSADGEFTAAGDFTKYSVSFKGLNSKGWTDLAKTLSSYASRDNVQALMSDKTDKYGKIVFSDLTPGLYLVVGIRHSAGGYNYDPQPILVSLPNYNEKDNNWEYEVTAEPKYERTKGSPDTPGPGKDDPGPGPGPGPNNHEKLNYSVIKVWKDKGSKIDRPDSVVAQLLRDGAVYAEATLSEENDWQHVWNDLDVGYDWSVVEERIPDGYTVSVNQEGTAFTITNTVKDDTPDNRKDPPVNENDPPNNDPPNNNQQDEHNDPPVNENDPPNNDHQDENNRDENNPTVDPDEKPTLPQTGMLWWPVPVMYTLGAGVFFAGYGIRRKGSNMSEDDDEETE